MTSDARKLFEKARLGDATAAAELWRSIAAGTADDSTVIAWARDVAEQVVAKVLNPEISANRRAEKARAALGLEGRVDQNRDLQALALEDAPHMSAADLSKVADLLIETHGNKPHKIKRQIEYIRTKAK